MRTCLVVFALPHGVSTCTCTASLSAIDSQGPLCSFLDLCLCRAPFLSVLCPTNFSCLSVPGLPSPYSQTHETAGPCQGFPSLSYRLESASWGKARVTVGPTLFLCSQGSPFCAAYCPMSENSCFISLSSFLAVSMKRESLVVVIQLWSETEMFLILLRIRKLHHFQT